MNNEPKQIRLVGLNIHITPLHVKAYRQSAGGIHIPEGVIDDAKQWLVLGVGPGRHVRRNGKLVFRTPEVRPGDRVLVDTGRGGHALEDGSWIVDERLCEMKW